MSVHAICKLFGATAGSRASQLLTEVHRRHAGDGRIDWLNASRVYLDHNATTPVRPEARAAMIDALACVGNPSSIHAEGRAARAILEAARRDVAALAGAAPEDVFFISGGTEALNMVLTPSLAAAEGPAEVLLVGAGEHAAVLAGHRFPAERVVSVPLTGEGVLDLVALDVALEEQAGRRVVLALQAANNETGVIQPVAEAAALVHARGGFVVCDAVQAPGKICCDIKAFDADAVALSAHKFGGPQGVGALILGPSRYHLYSGVVRGGGQERGLRSGTQNLVGIAGFGAAAALIPRCDEARNDQLRSWRAAIERIVTERAGAIVFGGGAERLANTVSFAVRGVEAQVLLMGLDLAGVSVSSGSACSSGKVKASHVLAAMGVAPDLTAGAIRVSLGWTTREEDVAAFATAFDAVMGRVRPRVGRIAA